MCNVGMRTSNDTEPISDSHTKSSGETVLSDSNREVETGGSEYTLTTSDIGDCIAAVTDARDVAKRQADPSVDPFAGIDLEQWQSVLVGFKEYDVG